MGLSLSVGMLSDLKEHDTEGLEFFREYFKEANKVLAANGLPAHVEPHDCAVWNADMYGYSGLHYLRRLAAYVDSGSDMPAPGTNDSSKDERLQGYFDDVEGKRPGIFKSLFSKPFRYGRNFDHLIVHSDAEGFYLPQDFPDVLFATNGEDVPGGMIGSTPRLLRECEQLAKVLGIPPDLDTQSEALWEASDSQGEGDELWQRYGVESFSCVVLMEACRCSISSGAAVVFA